MAINTTKRLRQKQSIGMILSVGKGTMQEPTYMLTDKYMTTRGYFAYGAVLRRGGTKQYGAECIPRYGFPTPNSKVEQVSAK